MHPPFLSPRTFLPFYYTVFCQVTILLSWDCLVSTQYDPFLLWRKYLRKPMHSICSLSLFPSLHRIVTLIYFLQCLYSLLPLYVYFKKAFSLFFPWFVTWIRTRPVRIRFFASNTNLSSAALLLHSNLLEYLRITLHYLFLYPKIKDNQDHHTQTVSSRLCSATVGEY